VQSRDLGLQRFDHWAKVMVDRGVASSGSALRHHVRVRSLVAPSVSRLVTLRSGGGDLCVIALAFSNRGKAPRSAGRCAALVRE
jgi:hypothetical protein